MQETFFLAGNRAVNTLTFISNVGCQIHPPGLETSEWHWLGSEQTSRPYNYGRPAACMWERKRDGPEDTQLFSGMFSLSCAFWPGHCPLRAGAAGIKRWIALSLEESRMLICFVLTEVWTPLVQMCIGSLTKRKLLWSKLLLMSRARSCPYQVTSLIFLPFALLSPSPSPAPNSCIFYAIWNVLKILTAWFLGQAGWDISVMSM